jgi:predicted TIM-barrel fold metal-dependent hydrolase
MSRIDFHVHVTPPDISKNWRKYAENEPYWRLLSQSRQNKFIDAAGVLPALDAAGIDRAVIFGFGFKDMGLCRYVNDYVIEKVKKYPERLIGFMSVPPNSGELETDIDRCHRAGLRGIGEIFPEGQDFDIEAGNPILSGACKERGLPLIIHANEPVGHDYAGKAKTSLRQFERFIENNPGLDIVLAHWGGGLMFYETMPELRKKCGNVYYDTAATPFLYDPRIYCAAAALGLTKKILLGSDFPLLPPSRYLGALAESGISPREQGLIMGGNAEQLLDSTFDV